MSNKPGAGQEWEQVGETIAKADCFLSVLELSLICYRIICLPHCMNKKKETLAHFVAWTSYFFINSNQQLMAVLNLLEQCCFCLHQNLSHSADLALHCVQVSSDFLYVRADLGDLLLQRFGLLPDGLFNLEKD